MRSRTALVLIGILIVGSAFTVSSVWRKHRVISWDVSGYYLYLPAVFIYDDLRTARFLPEKIDNLYQPSGTERDYARIQVGNGRVVMKFTMGMAIAYSPFFALAHAIARHTHYPADGYSRPYQMCMLFGGMLYGLLGLVVLRKLLLRYFTDQIVTFTLFGIAFGTNLYYYMVDEAPMSHGVLFMLQALLLYLSSLWHEHPRMRLAAAIGLVLGFAALVRPTELITVLFPLLWGLTGFREIPERLARLWQLRKQAFTAIAIAFVIGCMQLLYWKWATGHWVYDSYRLGGYFSFLRPHLAEGLLSYRKGWYLYTPLMLVATIGLFWVRRYAPATLLLGVFLLLNLYITLSWNPWWYGGSFGMRALIQSYAPLSLGLAAAFSQLTRSTRSTLPVLAILAVTVFLNLFQTVQYRRNIIDSNDMNKALYWKNFLKL